MALRSRTSNCTSSASYACVLGVLVGSLSGCSNSSEAVAELIDEHGNVERRVGDGEWKPATRGTRYHVGEAAHTKQGLATLDIASGAAKIFMTDQTTVRFDGTAQQVVINVDGEIDLSGRGVYALNVGDVSLPRDGGTVRINAKAGAPPTVKLVDGNARVAAAGATYDLVLGTQVDLQPFAPVPGDAGVRDARSAADAAVASPEATVDAGNPTRNATIVVAGPRAELLAPGAADWEKLPEGARELAAGSAIRIGARTSARVVANGTALELGGGARLKLDDELQVTLELGSNTAEATEPATIALPGGALALTGTPTAPAMARIEGNARDTKVAMLRGGAKLTGAAGAEHEIDRGESATLDRSGAIRYVETIPRYFDFRVVAGESLTIHDPRPPTAVQFQFDGKCPDGGIIEIDRNGSFRTARVSGGRDFANVMIARGTRAYRLRCTTNGAEGGAVASGRITELTDDGRRPLPKSQGVNDIDPDGRIYRISYQSTIPNVSVRVKNPGATHRLHLASAGREQTFDSSTPAITVPSSQLREGTYTYWIDRDGVKQDKVSTLIIDFDQTAPQVYIESPLNGQPWSGDIDVRGAVLPGWSAAVDEIAIPIDKQRRFAAKVGIPGGGALAIRLSHPQRGVHYYLRRPK
jgi:hypothetical protein